MKKTIFIGKAYAGKSYLRNFIEANTNIKFPVSYTTRLPRDGEIDKVHYNFTTKEHFEYMIENDIVAEFGKFGDYYYGTSMESYNNCQCFIFEPDGFYKIIDKFGKNTFNVVYLKTTPNLFDDRRIKRDGVMDLKHSKRLELDDKVFSQFESKGLYDMIIEVNSDSSLTDFLKMFI